MTRAPLLIRGALLALLLLPAACSTKPPPPELLARLDTYYANVEKIAGADRGELEVSVIGHVRDGGRNLPVQMLSRVALGQNNPRILILAEPGGERQTTSEIVLETARQLIRMPSLYGNAHIDLIPLAAPRTLLGRSGPGRSDRRIISRFLQDRSYDLIILHRADSDRVGFSVARRGGLEDDAAFILSRVRDHGYFTTRPGAAAEFPQDGLAGELPRRGDTSMMVFSSWRQEEREKAIFSHLLAQETAVRLLVKNIYQ